MSAANQITNHPPAYCPDCGGRLYRRSPDQTVDACPQCGREFSWLEESSWATSYLNTRPATRLLGGAGAALVAVFLLGAVQAGSLPWLIAFLLGIIISGKLAYLCLR